MKSMRDFFVRGELRRLFPQLQRKLELADAYQRVLGDGAAPEGRIVLTDFLREAGLLEVAREPDDSRFYDGKRAMALYVLDKLRWSASELMQLGQQTTMQQLIDREMAEAG